MTNLIPFVVLLVFQANSSNPSANQGEPAESPDSAWNILNDGLTDKSSDKRAKATQALGLLPLDSKGPQLALKALKTDPNSDVRAQGATALGEMHAISAAPQLKEAFNDTDIKVVLAAANALYTFKDPAAYEVYYAILTGKRKSSDGLIKSQLDMLKDKKQLEKLAFEAGIGFVPFGGMSWQAIQTITHNDGSSVMALAAERLGTDPDPKSAEALRQACYDSKWAVRLAAVQAIAKRGDPALVHAVGPLLYDNNDSVRFSAAATVIRLSSETKTFTPRPNHGRGTNGN